MVVGDWSVGWFAEQRRGIDLLYMYFKLVVVVVVDGSWFVFVLLSGLS